MTRVLTTMVCVCLGVSPAWASNCLVTSIGQAPVVYVQSAAHLAAGLEAAAGVVPRNASGEPSATGKIGMLCVGQSIANTVCAQTRSLLRYDPDKAPALTFIGAAYSGHTAERWADPGSDTWTRTASKVAGAALTAAQVQVVVMLQTEARGPMTEIQLRAIADNFQQFYPNVRVIIQSGPNYLGYVDPKYWDKVHEPRNGFNDAALMASVVESGGWPQWQGFSDLWADGTTVNPVNGLSYVCADMATDGHHPTAAAARRMGASWLARWKADPVMAWMWR